MAEDTRYYFCEDGETSVGPFTEGKLQELLAKDVIDGNVWLCVEGSEEWKIAADWPQFAAVDRVLLVSESGAPAEVSAGAAENVIHSSVLAEAFADFATEEERARELRRLQRAAARVDLREYREGDTERDQVSTDDDVNQWWFLRFLRLKDFVIGAAFALCAALLFIYFTRGNATEDAAPTADAQPVADVQETRTATVVAPAPAPAQEEPVLSGPAGVPMGEPAARQTTQVQVASPEPALKPLEVVPPDDEPPAAVAPIAPPNPETSEPGSAGDLANSRTGSVEDTMRAPEYYLLDRRHKVSTRQGTMVIAENSRVRVISKSADRWTVEADGTRFEVSPADLRRDNTEGVLTVGAEVDDRSSAGTP